MKEAVSLFLTAPCAFPPAPLPRPHLFRHGSVLHAAVAHLISVLNAGKGMGGKGMKTSEIPLPPIPLPISAAAPPHVHHAWHLFSGSVQARQRFASRGGSSDFCFECRQRNGWQGNENLRNSFATHSLANLCRCTASCASCLASFLTRLEIAPDAEVDLRRGGEGPALFEAALIVDEPFGQRRCELAAEAVGCSF